MITDMEIHNKPGQDKLGMGGMRRIPILESVKWSVQVMNRGPGKGGKAMTVGFSNLTKWPISFTVRGMGVPAQKSKTVELSRADRYNKKRERIKLANRRRILEAALDVFADIGYDRARVRDIIAASGLSPGTFYNHFRSKEEIFDQLLDGFLRDLEADIDRTLEDIRNGIDLAGDVFHKLLKAFTKNHKVMKVAARNQAILRGLRSDSKVSRLFRKSEELIERGMGVGLLPKAPIQILNLMIFGTAFEIVAYLSDKPKYNINRIAGDLSTFFMGGLEALSKKYENKDEIPELDDE